MKRILATIAACILAATMTKGAAPTDGLILHYTFSGNAQDATHLQLHGQAFSGAALAQDRFGEANSAYWLNGVGGFIEATGPLPETDSITVSLWLALESWVQVQNWGAPQVIFFEGDDGPGRDLACYIGGGFHFVVKANEGLDYNNWLPPLGVWTHLVCVADAAAQKMAIWINGQKKAEGPFSGGANFGYHAPFNLGRRPGGYNDWFTKGSMDDVRVYDRALTDFEIASLHAAELGNARSLTIEIETLRLTFGVIPGERYILQWSRDLMSWEDYGQAFVATAATHMASVNATDARTFWRVLSRP